jgi:NifC-like ABC-type porter
MGRKRLLDAALSVPLAIVVLTVAGVIVALAVRVPPDALIAALLSSEIAFAVGLSLKSSVAALAVAVALGVPAAYLMARRDFPGKAVLDTLLDIPLVMPPLVAGVGLLMLLSRSMLGAPLARWGLDVLFSPAGIVVAQAFVAVAVVIRSSRAAFAAVDPGYAQAAATLGAPPLATWLAVELPLAARGIAAGAVMAWSRALGEFGATLMVAGATRMRTETLPMAVFLNIATGETATAIACALVLLFLAAVLLLILRLIGGGWFHRDF